MKILQLSHARWQSLEGAGHAQSQYVLEGVSAGQTLPQFLSHNYDCGTSC